MTPSDDNPALSGVQCESCHGAGRMYSPRYVMKDKELAKLLGLLPITEDQCAPCHTKDSPSVREFKFDEKLMLVRHKPHQESSPGKDGRGGSGSRSRLAGDGSQSARP